MTAKKEPGESPSTQNAHALFHPKYKPEFAKQAVKLCTLGATDANLADFFEVTPRTIHRWKISHADFAEALRRGKDVADDLVADRLFQRATGYSHDAVKIFMPKGKAQPVYAPYVEHCPPDVAAAIFWLKNRRPNEWRERQELTGKDGAPLVPVLNVTYGSSQPSPAPQAG